MIEDLERLVQLRDKGALTEEEFTQAKRRLLSSGAPEPSNAMPHHPSPEVPIGKVSPTSVDSAQSMTSISPENGSPRAKTVHLSYLFYKCDVCVTDRVLSIGCTSRMTGVHQEKTFSLDGVVTVETTGASAAIWQECGFSTWLLMFPLIVGWQFLFNSRWLVLIGPGGKVIVDCMFDRTGANRVMEQIGTAVRDRISR